MVGGLIGGGLEIYDQYKNGTLEWSWKSVGKIAVSTLQGAGEGALLGSGAGIPAMAAGVFASEVAGTSLKEVIDGESVLDADNIKNNLVDATINTAITMAGIGVGKFIGKVAPKISSKMAPYLRNLISHDELSAEGIADWLFKYAGSGASDAKEALALLAQYTGAEAAYDVLINRFNSKADSKINEVINQDDKE